MKTKIISSDDWRPALSMLLDGAIIAIPTDTVYGIAALPENETAIEAVYAAKDRPADKALPMLVSSIDEAQRIGVLDERLIQLGRAFWPGALTIVANAAPAFHSPAIAADGTVAVRMPGLDLALEIIAAAGGVLAVTSANLSGRPPATNAPAVLEELEGRIAAVVDGGECRGGVPSSVVKLSDQGVEILREGAISSSDLRSVFQEQ
jgi:L-threonylcarbamoyladenylate synthase